MTKSAQQGLTVAGILLALVSLPMAWQTIRVEQVNVSVNGLPFGGGDAAGQAIADSFGSMAVGSVQQVTGLNGFVTLGLKLPYWFLIALVCIAGVLQILSKSSAFQVPRTFLWIIALTPLFFIAASDVLPVLIGKGHPETGGIIALLSSAIMIVCMGAPTEESTDSSSVES